MEPVFAAAFILGGIVMLVVERRRPFPVVRDAERTPVSRALGKDTSDKVAPELRAKIRETARQVNYVPHPAAQLMRKPKVHLITALLPFETGAFVSEFYGAVLSGVVAASREWETETRVALVDPNDVDIILLMEDTFDLASVSGEAALVFQHSEADAHFGASIFWACRSGAIGGEQAMIEYWQVRREGGRRGIVEITPEGA